jgi:acetyl esterase/lipase
MLRPASFAPPRGLGRAVALSVRREGTGPVYLLQPPSAAGDVVVVYLHGGSYTGEILFWHWRLVRYLTLAAPADVTVPIYPLAPWTTASATVPGVTGLLHRLLADPRPVVVMGDSAGAGLAVAAAQQLRDEHGVRPARLVLISPWLDVTGDDPAEAVIEPRDRMLALPGGREHGRFYAGDLDLRHPWVSPLFGDVAGLAPIDVFTGTHDMINPQAHRLVAACRAGGTPVRLHEEPGMQHDYPLLPLVRQGRRARAELARIVREAGAR